MGFVFDPLLFSGLVPVNPPSAVPTVPTSGSLPVTAADGALYITLDTGDVWEYRLSIPAWVIVAGPGVMLGIGTIDSQTPSANGAVDANNALVLQSASATVPGLVNNTTQTFSGQKTVDIPTGGLIARFTASSSGDAFITVNTNGGGIAQLGADLGANDGFVGTANSTPFHIRTANANRVDIDATGNVTIANGALSMNSHQIHSVTDPSSPQDAMTLNYADSTYIPLSQKGQPNGVASLDGAGKVPYAQLPSALMTFKGAWNPTTNIPVLVNGTGLAGDTYRVSVDGTSTAPISALWYAGDFIIYNGSVWQRSPLADGVISVNGFTGAVILTQGDLTDVGTDGITVTNGSNSVWGSGTSIAQHVADATHNGYLASTDFNTFNGKMNTNFSNSIASTVALDLGTHQIHNVVNPVSAQDAATKNYVDTFFPVTVPNGGTGVTTLSAHGILLGNGTSNVNVLTAGAGGTVLTGQGAALDPAFSFTPVIGANGSTTGKVILAGGTSGQITIQPQTAAGTFNFNLPITAGSAGQVLTSQGGVGSAMTWTTLASAVTNNKELFTLSGTDITNQFVDLAHVALTNSIEFVVKGGGVQIEGAAQDYTVNYTGGVGSNTRITFVNGLATGGVSALVAGDVVVAKYQF